MAPVATDPSSAAAARTQDEHHHAAPPRREPPPEKPADARRRTYVILSFWLLILGLGLPIWWKTTAIYRAKLPLDEMMEWADGKACRPVFPLRIAVQAPDLQDHEAQNLVRLTQHALDDLNDFSAHHLRLQLAPRDGPPAAAAADDDDDDHTNAVAAPPPPHDNGSSAALVIRLVPGDATRAALHPTLPVLDITYPPHAVPASTASSYASSLATYVAAQLRATFAEERAILSYLLAARSAPADPRAPPSLAPDLADALAKRTTRSLRYAPTYHLTFSLFTPGPAPSSWDVDAALDRYMRPVLDLLAPLHNFTIDTQVQLYAAPGVQAGPVLTRDHLSSFVNAAEWPLSPSIGGAPTVNFVVYVGNQTIALASQDRGDESGKDDDNHGDHQEGDTAAAAARSWLIPQWGSVYLLPLPDDLAHVPADALRAPLRAFAAHLLSLLGTPQSGSLPLRLATLSRVRSADLLLRASSTLGSLARLTRALPSIAIPPSVADGVAATLRHLRLACDTLGQPEGLAHARVAEREAERAFFEKSMVGQLYFPDEHKIAVYLPLLGPVGVPLVMGLLNELRAWRKRRRERADKAAEKKAT